MNLDMQAKITNVYTNESLDNKNLKGDHGQAFYITIGDKNILFDTGTKSDILLHNMKILGISPSNVDQLFFSHGHYDHTGGLPGFLGAVNPVNPLPVFGHPSMMEKKIIKIGFIKRNIGFPELSEEQQQKIDLRLSRESIELTTGFTSTGEINNRPYRDGREPNAFHESNGKFEVDPVLDDQSLVLDTTKGLVLITGCCHAGLLNTLKHVEEMKNKPFRAIIGGTHMVRFSENEVHHVANLLEQEYGFPDLYLNHCTDNLPIPLIKKTPVTKILKRRFGEEKVKTCHVGTEFLYEI
jgi:7,8-dihydropterin-6-yl-methyl-4-(beta-D-ribofuranosyl)aminobenzene 5'-phosphate synthase